MNIILENVALIGKQKAWVTMGLPTSRAKETGIVTTSAGTKFPAEIVGDELFVEAELEAGQILNGTYQTQGGVLPEFKFSPWITDELDKVLPTFSITKNGILRYSLPMVLWDRRSPRPAAYWSFVPTDTGNARRRIEMVTQIPDYFITIKCWFDVFSNQDIVNFEIKATYGHTRDQNKLTEVFGSLQMLTGEATTIYHAKRKGLRPRLLRTDLGRWETELVAPRQWLRARAHDCQGVMLCMPPYDKVVQEREKDPVYFDTRYATIVAAQQAPILGIADVWENSYLGFKNTHKFAPGVGQNIINQAYRDMISDENSASDELAPRRYAQPPNSGQTGEQPDFGASKLELAVTLKRPFSLFTYRHSAEAWALRPYHNLEADGTPVKVANHPNTRTYNLRPDERFSPLDMLNWPNPVPYFEQYGTSDDEHRSDNLLLGLYALTKSPSLRDTILAIIEMEKANVNLTRGMVPIGAPRGWGRPLLSLVHMLSLGFNDVAPLINTYVNNLYSNASMFKIPQLPDRTIRTLSSNGAKYGWLDNTGNPIWPCWVPWEEAIAAEALYGIWVTMKNPRALHMALEIAKTVCNHAMFKQNNQWFACYAIKLDTLNLGKPLPSSAYTVMNPPELNKEVFVYGMQTWMLPALMFMVESYQEAKNLELTKHIISEADIARANEIINFFAPGGLARNLTEAGWWAV